MDKHGCDTLKFDLDYARRVIDTEAKAVSSMANLVNDTFAQAAAYLYQCEGSVILTGIGKAGIIAQKISATLASTGTPSHFLHPAEAVHGDLGRLRRADIVLVLSFGGETDEIKRLINLVKQLQVRLIAITGNAQSMLAKHSDVVLCMPAISEAGPHGVAPTVSTTCMLAVGDALALTVMKAREFSVEDFARFHPGGSLGAKLITVEQSMMFKPGQNLPCSNLEDTLEQMLDKNRDVIRHGAVMVVDENGRLAGIITDADLRRRITQLGPDALKTKASQAMTADCKRIKAKSLAAEAMAIFNKFRIDELPVVDDDDKPIGLIDVQDIVAIKIVN